LIVELPCQVFDLTVVLSGLDLSILIRQLLELAFLSLRLLLQELELTSQLLVVPRDLISSVGLFLDLLGKVVSSRIELVVKNLDPGVVLLGFLLH
jgi:hypothetical protein